MMRFLCQRIEVIAHNCHIKLTKKVVLNILVLLSGLVFLCLQIWNTFQTFIEQRSTFSISIESFDGLKIPAIIVHPRFHWDNEIMTGGKPADKDWYFGQLYRLNHQFNLTIVGVRGKRLLQNESLVLGENYDEEGNPFLKVEELMHPENGLYYALVFNENYRLKSKDLIYLWSSFEKEGKIPKIDFNIVSPEDRYRLLLHKRGNLNPLIISSEAGKWVDANMQQLKWNYLPSKRNCRHYSIKEDTYMECVMKSQADCYLTNGPNEGCKCIPENSLKTYFEMYPTSWKPCQTTSEYKLCMDLWWDCSHRRYFSRKRKCPLPCTKEKYKGQNYIADGMSSKIPPNVVMVRIGYKSMDVETHNEVLIQDVSNFIGTIGGSLGLFIGFSYTGFVGKIIDLLWELF